MNKEEKIRAEIERRKKLHEKSLTNPIHEGFGLQKVIESKISELTYLLSFVDSMQKEPKECMYSKDDYTDEDRKVLCGGCEEDCRFNKKEESVNNGIDLGCGVIWKDEEPVSEDLEQAIDTYLATYFGSVKEKQDWPFLKKMAIHFANWKEQQLMAKAVEHKVKVDAGGYTYIPQIELYDYDNDVPLAKEGDKYKVILIKED